MEEDTAPEAWVEAVYATLLEREADPEGLAYWSGLLAEGRLTEARLCEAVAEGAAGEEREVALKRVAALEIAGAYLEEESLTIGSDALEAMLFNLKIVDTARYPLEAYVAEYLAHHAEPAPQKIAPLPAEAEEAVSPNGAEPEADVMTFLINDLLFL